MYIPSNKIPKGVDIHAGRLGKIEKKYSRAGVLFKPKHEHETALLERTFAKHLKERR